MQLNDLLRVTAEKNVMLTRERAQRELEIVEHIIKDAKEDPAIIETGIDVEDDIRQSGHYISMQLALNLDVRVVDELDDILLYEDGAIFVSASRARFEGTDGQKLILAEFMSKLVILVATCHGYGGSGAYGVVMNRLRAGAETSLEHLMACSDYRQLIEVIERNAMLLPKSIQQGIEQLAREMGQEEDE